MTPEKQIKKHCLSVIANGGKVQSIDSKEKIRTVNITNSSSGNWVGVNMAISWNHKFIAYPLRCLTEPITVENYNDGEEFVPCEEFSGVPLIQCVELAHGSIDIRKVSYGIIEKLHSWNFFLGDQELFNTGELIDKSKI